MPDDIFDNISFSVVLITLLAFFFLAVEMGYESLIRKEHENVP